MYGVLAEDHSDVEVLKTIIGRLNRRPKPPSVLGKGYSGCDELLRDGARDLRNFARRQCRRYIICYDSDEHDPEERRRRVIERVVAPSGITESICVLVPVQEIEAWILADLDAIKSVIRSWKVGKPIANPEGIRDPKEYLRRLSKTNGRPLYTYATHNPVVAQALDLDKVHAKCPSFRPLAELVRSGKGNLEA